MKKLKEPCRVALVDCLAVKEKDKVLIITDEVLRKIGYAFFQTAKELGMDVVLTEIVPRKNHGEEPPEIVSELMENADVIIAPTSKSLSHTTARKNANKQGARIVTLPNINEDIMVRTLSCDYNRIKELTEKLTKILTAGKEATVVNELGTEISLSIETRKGLSDTGIVHTPGSFSNLPAGESFIAPLEGTANGVICFTGSFAGVGKLKGTLKIYVENGLAVKVEGDRKVEEKFKTAGEPEKNIAELGIGTNYKAKLSGNVLEDEKVLGTVHIALGDNHTFGGKVHAKFHHDGMIAKPTLKIDGKLIMERGKLVV